MKKYRILLLFDKSENLDANVIQKRMAMYGISNICVERGQPVGNRSSLQFYFDSDIPLSSTIAENIIPNRNETMDVIQEVMINAEKWVNVNETLPKVCEAAECTNDIEMTVTQGEKGNRRLTFLCNYHAQSLQNGNPVPLKQTGD
jgi:hypothetical protein